MFHLRVDEEVKIGLLEERHAPALFALVEQNRLHLREWLPWLDTNVSVEDTKAFINGGLHQFVVGNGFQGGILYNQELVGAIGYHKLDYTNRRTEIGYWLAASAQDKGIMTRACRKMVDYAIRELGMNRVEIRCATGNLKSQAIPERLGFHKEGVHRQMHWNYDRFLDLVVYSMLAEEWLASNQS